MTSVDRIFQLIKEKGLTAKDFANAVGVSQGNVTDWKTGRAKPSIESLQKISNKYNVRLEWLIGDSELRTTKDVLNDYLTNHYITAINTAILTYWDEFLKTGIKKSEIDDFVNVLVSDHSKTSEENVERIKNYVLKFKPRRRKYLIDLIFKIFNDLEQSENDMNTAHHLLSKLEEEERIEKKEVETNNNNNSQDIPLLNKFYMCPVYGKISAGIPNWVEECLEGYLPLDTNLMGIIDPKECFFLKVDGESMNKVIHSGAYALIRKQDIVENGEIAAVLVNSFEATLKKFTKQGDLVILEPMSDDASFTTQVYNKDTDIKILGKYIGKFEMNK